MVTFGKMEKGEIPGDEGWIRIYFDDVEVGGIESQFTDVGATNRVYRISGYEVTFWEKAGLGQEADKYFDVDPFAGEARTILANAKAYVREVTTDD